MTMPLRIMLADDDSDDRFFFDEAMKSAPMAVTLNTVDNGEKLLLYLNSHKATLPDALFLDMNMPRKNGSECLLEIKEDSLLKDLPVIMYSTSLHSEVADVLFTNGAHYYIKKGNSQEMQVVLDHVLTLIQNNKFSRPNREHFILNSKHLNPSPSR